MKDEIRTTLILLSFYISLTAKEKESWGRSSKLKWINTAGRANYEGEAVLTKASSAFQCTGGNSFCTVSSNTNGTKGRGNLLHAESWLTVIAQHSLRQC